MYSRLVSRVGPRAATGPHPDTVANTATQMAGAVSSSATQTITTPLVVDQHERVSRYGNCARNGLNGRAVTKEFR
jgi:hypothetical protein